MKEKKFAHIKSHDCHVLMTQFAHVKGTLGKKSINANDHASLSKAHFTVLQQSALVAPYIEEHKQIIRSKYPWKFETWIIKNHIETFLT
jgi:hypothetical protein